MRVLLSYRNKREKKMKLSNETLAVLEYKVDAYRNQTDPEELIKAVIENLYENETDNTELFKLVASNSFEDTYELINVDALEKIIGELI